jgi:hypothetical protein
MYSVLYVSPAMCASWSYLGLGNRARQTVEDVLSMELIYRGAQPSECQWLRDMEPG